MAEAATTEAPVTEQAQEPDNPNPYGIAGLDAIQIPDAAFGIREELPAQAAASDGEPPVEGQPTPPAAEAQASAQAESTEAEKLYSEQDWKRRERELSDRWEQTRLQRELGRQRDELVQQRHDLVLRANNGDMDAQAELAADEAAKLAQAQSQAQIARQYLAEVDQANQTLAPHRATELDPRNFTGQPLAAWVAAHRDDAAVQAVEAFKAKELPALRQALEAEVRAERRSAMPAPPLTQSVGGGYSPAPQIRSYAEAITLEAEGKLSMRELVDARAHYLAGRLPAGQEYGLELAR